MSAPAPPPAAATEEKAVASAAAAAKGKEKVEVAPVAAAAAEAGKGRYVVYPAPVAEHAEVVADAARFRAALERLHAHMGTRLKVPIIGGKDLDLHQLYKEVTSRGGIDKARNE
ncbi:unnamed protein product [Urochloa humidicola]